MKPDSEHQFHKPEILAPAGTFAALQAAVNAGCDAVYLGGSLFSARAFAGNFDREEMLQAIDYCHLFGVRLYMTVNTLLKDAEIAQLEDYMRPFYKAGLDGVIVQDAGVVRVLRRAFPDLPLHASTQMSIASSYGAKFLKRQGICRIVPARELSLEEIRTMKEETGMEIETFVHGAMCYAYSGKCLFSSFLGGRSGNRGRCAGPCRKYYTLQTADGRKTGGYLMSLKDMCTLPILPRLTDAGIDSFKIEGRMKNPSYVAGTVAAYRKALDCYLELSEYGAYHWEDLSLKKQQQYLHLAAELTKQMQDIYNRGGFCTGYYFTDKGPEMLSPDRPNHTGILVGTIESLKGPDISIRLKEDLHTGDVLEIFSTGTELTSNKEGKAGGRITLKGKDLRRLRSGMEVYRTRNQELLQRIEQEILQPEKKIRASAYLRAKVGEPLLISMESAEGSRDPREPVRIEVMGSVVERAGSRPLDPAQLISKMQKNGGTHLDVQVICDADPEGFVPLSELNALRRTATENLRQSIEEQYRR